ncbi:hypothetical protein [Zavarzinia sp.]|uniref:hypothetical protein n=1 Tax=Zavarzinia sp. TaxID=2027920 RepID=UPI003BB63509
MPSFEQNPLDLIYLATMQLVAAHVGQSSNDPHIGAKLPPSRVVAECALLARRTYEQMHGCHVEIGETFPVPDFSR